MNLNKSLINLKTTLKTTPITTITYNRRGYGAIEKTKQTIRSLNLVPYYCLATAMDMDKLKEVVIEANSIAKENNGCVIILDEIMESDREALIKLTKLIEERQIDGVMLDSDVYLVGVSFVSLSQIVDLENMPSCPLVA